MTALHASKLAGYAKDDGYEYEGLWCEDALTLLSSILGFCGCGQPDEALKYALTGLEQIHERKTNVWPLRDTDERNSAADALNARVKEHYKTTGAEYFFYYWASKQGLIEHGGSVPGWLDEKGEQVLSLLREWAALPKEDE